MAGITDAERERRLIEQSRAEVPGFDARTRVDDAIGKLIALRRRLAVTPELLAVLDDLDEITDRAVALGHDPDAPDFDLIAVAVDHRRPGGAHWECLRNSGADVFGGRCSCGGIVLGDAIEANL